MQFRNHIQDIIEKQSPTEAALAICILLDEELDLEANGWFENDPELCVKLKEHWEKIVKEASEATS